MLYNRLAYAAAFSASTVLAANNAGGSTNSLGGTTLSANVIQKGSTADGSTEIGAEAGEALSSTSTNNFINFCSGQPLTNGLQITTGSCNGIRKYPL